MTLKRRLYHLEEHVNALALRERVLLLIALLGIAFVVADMTLLRPLAERRGTIGQQLEQVRERVATLSTSIQQMAQQAGSDPNAPLRRERESLNRRIERLSAELSQLDTGLLTPEQTLDVLRQVLSDQPGLRLVSLSKLPAEALDPENDPGGIFVHRFSIVLEAGFAGILDYVRLIERLPQSLYWESMRLDVPEWPTNRAEIVLYMLTLDEDWLGV